MAQAEAAPDPVRTRRSRRAGGFALVVTVSLMVVLAMLAMGLLSLSSVVLRSSATADGMAQARANARLALTMAIAQLQFEAGPDTRISTAADQLSATDPGETRAAVGRRFWTGIYDAWPAPVDGDDSGPRPEPTFRSWLVSGPAAVTASEAAAETPARENEVEIVGRGTLGGAMEGRIAVPAIASPEGRLAWWVGDEGLKAALSTTPGVAPATPVQVRTGLQAAPPHAVGLATAAGHRPFASLDARDPRLAVLTSWPQAQLLADDPERTRELFHDLAPATSGLLTNVRRGGFRRDLSLYLGRDRPPSGGFPHQNGALYMVEGKPGIRDGELWVFHNLHKQLESGKGEAFSTGGSFGADVPHLRSGASKSEALADPAFYYKRPVIISYKALFSFSVRKTANPERRYLTLVVDPAVTLWNPFDVPLVVTPGFYSIRFQQIPYEIENLRVGTRLIPKLDLASVISRQDSNYVTLTVGKQGNGGDPLVLRPGEVVMMSQGAGSSTRQGLNWNIGVAGKTGWNFGGGIEWDVIVSGSRIELPDQPVSLSFSRIKPNQNVVRQGTAGRVGVNHCELYFLEDRASLGSSLGVGGVFVDYRWAKPYEYSGSPKPDGSRFFATSKPDTFVELPGTGMTLDPNADRVNDLKRPFLFYGYDAKTEEDAKRPGCFLARFNPSASLVDFSDLSDRELNVSPFEVKIEAVNSLKELPIDVNAKGNGYFGGGVTGGAGVTAVSTHSVPREAPVSLASFQYAMANGFDRDAPTSPDYGDNWSNMCIRMPMLPHVSHPIGNSIAPAVLPPDRTTGMLSGGRPLADHSYLANQALWDDWFLSGIDESLSEAGGPPGRSRRSMVSDFLGGDGGLPVARYRADVAAQDPEALLDRFFSGDDPNDRSIEELASIIRVDGMFNVNSTSVEAWKTVLAGLKDHRVVVRNDSGAESIEEGGERVAVSGLVAPTGKTADGPMGDPSNPEQWTGRRTLDEDQVGALAEALVAEIRKRGPFLSLADFVNRRVGTNVELARCGGVQAAIDGAGINFGYDSRKAEASESLEFSEAEKDLPAAYGIPGIVKQADILTPIAPVLSVRSDTFVIRSYGEARDASGNRVLARAWCEAVVERDRDFVDPRDKPETELADLLEVNRRFGRRFVITAFRWLHPEEV